MTDHIYGENSYVECDHYTVVSVTPYSDFGPKFSPEQICYCGEPTVQVARVGFHTRLDDPDEETWPRSISQNVKVHRCDKHGFEVDKLKD